MHIVLPSILLSCKVTANQGSDFHQHGLQFLNHFLSGACHCQLMDCIFPGSVDMTKVKLDAQSEDDCRHNYSLLQEAFSKKDVRRVCTSFK